MASERNEEKAVTVEESSGNVFADLGHANAPQALAKSELARFIAHALTRRSLTQRQAAELLGIDQPKVSNILRGRLRGFSITRLITYLMALNHDVEIVVHAPAPRKRKPGTISVLAPA